MTTINELDMPTLSCKEDPLCNLMLFRKTIKFMDEIVLILDKNHKIIFANRALYQTIGTTNESEILHRGIGEVFSCVQACNARNGCGTREECPRCGAAKSIIESKRNGYSTHECQIIQSNSKRVFDFRVKAIAEVINSDPVTFLIFSDISCLKKKQLFERIFLHDLSNSAGAILGICSLFSSKSLLEFENIKLLESAAHNISDEIQFQRQLIEAERGVLHLNYEEFCLAHTLKELCDIFNSSLATQNKRVLFQKRESTTKIVTDIVLFKRVIGNCIKNAIEASRKGENVRLSYMIYNENIQIQIHSATFIKEEFHEMIFHPSFSTKGKGRGFGTYSVKLFVESYLNGKVSFSSSLKTGTTFYILLPLNHTTAQNKQAPQLHQQ